jgi:ABC-type branched-subunit amino acid transport system ATPase component
MGDHIAVFDFGQLIVLSEPTQVRTDSAVIAVHLGHE